MRIANLVSRRELFSWSPASEDGQSSIASNRTGTMVDHDLIQLNRSERLYVFSGEHVQNHMSATTMKDLRRERSLGAKIRAICFEPTSLRA